MKSWIPSALAGLAIGGLLAYGYLSHVYGRKLDLARQELEELRNSSAEKEKELKTNQTLLTSVQEINRQLTAKTQVGATTETPGTESAAEAEPAQRDRSEERRNFYERAARWTIDRWQDPLKLTPEQIQRLNELLAAQMQNGQPGGNPWNPSSIQNAMLQVLNPAQKAEFEHAQARENQARMELRVQSQLTQVQSMFDLTEAQKDQIFQKFAQMEQNPSANSVQPGNRQARQEQAQKRVQALQGILTADQIRQYEQSQNRNAGFQGR